MSDADSRESDEPHVAFYLPSLRGGGAEKVILNLASEFAARDYQVDIVLVSAHGEYLSQVPDTVNVVDFDTGRFFLALPQLAAYLKRSEPDVMLSTIDTANVVAICAKRVARVSTRVVIRISNMLSTKEANGELKHRLVHRAAKYVYPYADEVVAVSDGVKSDLLEMTNLSAVQVTTIYNPSVTEELLRKRTETVDHPWFAPDAEMPVVLGVGELSEQKDFETLIRAFASVASEQSVRLVILGEGDRSKRLRELTAELGVDDLVSMPGFVENPFAYMANADVFVLSSQWEGCPNVLIEALACDVPVVSTDCPSGPYEILEGGMWGRLVPVRDHNAMAKAIEAVLNDEIVRSTEEYAISRFSVHEVTNAYEQALRL
ncbi:putative glycosyltransferase [Natrinema pallidum DSM 3751]|uniref:Putative glycosyltransferase n=1 Tax=Natrinema pallidum DSM 3751 TaxID=1227495 RepID=L9YZQ6_9EURY|nr:glycosyltransferase [Natrinema pallidum]ELY79740.1 putative glycosyltransferase [Natrinema pallidum DSM 3751]